MNPHVYWGPPGPWRDRFELLAIECRIAVLARAAGPVLDDLYEYEDRAGDPLDRPRLRDEEAVWEYHRRREHHYRAWDRKVRALQTELDLARQCHQTEHLPEGTTFYVSAAYYADHVILAGPFERHEEALRLVPRAREVVSERDVRGFLYGYGTCSLPPGCATTPPREDLHRAIVTPPAPPAPPAPSTRARTRSVTAYTHGAR